MTIPGFVSDHDARERALLDAARGGDERAFGLLLERYQRRLEECCGLTVGERDALGRTEAAQRAARAKLAVIDGRRRL